MYEIIDEYNVSKYLSEDNLKEIFQILLKEAKDIADNKSLTIGYIFLDHIDTLRTNKKKLSVKFLFEKKESPADKMFQSFIDVRIMQMVIYDEIPDFLLDDFNDLKKEAEKSKINKTKEFFNWFIEWVKPKLTDISIFISVPNELQPIKENDIDVYDAIILDIFEKINQKLDAKIYLQEILDKADEFSLKIYLKPIPRYKYIKSKKHKSKITQEYLINYYKNFGFEISENEYLVRKPIIYDEMD
jgi:hypothetical protein